MYLFPRRVRASVIVSFLLTVLFAFPQTLCAQSAFPPGRYALVAGNSEYSGLAPLKNPGNDARDMAALLEKIGFSVRMILNSDLVTMEDAVERLAVDLSANRESIGIFYYAGHAVQSEGQNYLIPSNATIPGEPYLRERALAENAILETISKAKNRFTLIIMDSCRDNPFSWSRSGLRGMAPQSTSLSGYRIFYATAAGGTAQDGEGRNGVFTGELLRHLGNPELTIGEVFNRTGAAVQAATGEMQRPSVYSTFYDEIYLAKKTAADPVPVASIQKATASGLFWHEDFTDPSVRQAWAEGDNHTPFKDSANWKVMEGSMRQSEVKTSYEIPSTGRWTDGYTSVKKIDPVMSGVLRKDSRIMVSAKVRMGSSDPYFSKAGPVSFGFNFASGQGFPSAHSGTVWLQNAFSTSEGQRDAAKVMGVVLDGRKISTHEGKLPFEGYRSALSSKELSRQKKGMIIEYRIVIDCAKHSIAGSLRFDGDQAFTEVATWQNPAVADFAGSSLALQPILGATGTVCDFLEIRMEAQ
jgi:hypothetical protein